MARDNRCMYIENVCFYVRCRDCCVAGIVNDSGFQPWSVEVCCVFV